MEVRTEATNLLGNLQESDWAKPFLINKLLDPIADVRKSAALSLMKLKAFEAIDELEKIYLIEKDKEVARVIILSISQLKNARSI